MNKVVVVIPVHKSALTQNELASLKQCYKILGSHPIRIVAPEGMDMSVYKNAVPGCETTFIAPEWLSSIQQYNKLKISKYFYDLFKDYEYLLTYELDAWVFRDELLYWCDKGYDYIGAPWFEGYKNTLNIQFLQGGNSGFSLRNIQATFDVIKKIHHIKKVRDFFYKSKLQSLLTFEKAISIFKRLWNIKNIKNLKYLLYDYWDNNEDYFLSSITPTVFENYLVASPKEALQFSFEGNPQFLFEKNNYQLPFGCHAWEKNKPEFWKEFINNEF